MQSPFTTLRLPGPFARRRGRGAAFDYASLFANGEQGVVLISKDMATRYQDATGITPVTAAGDPVGLMLDKSEGLARGLELVTNGTFDDGLSGWETEIIGDGTVTLVDGGVELSGTDSDNRAILKQEGLTDQLVDGRFYEVSFDVLSISGEIQAGIGFDVGSNLTIDLDTSSEGNRRGIFQYNGGNRFIWFRTTFSGSTAVIGNVTIREIKGNHAVQEDAAKRPEYRNNPPHLLRDGLDDSLDWTAPAGAYTVARVNAAGAVTIETEQALDDATDIFHEDTVAGYVAIDRELTAGETSDLTAYLQGLVA